MTEIMGFDERLRSFGIEYGSILREHPDGLSEPPDHVNHSGQIARTILLADDRGYALAVIPSDRHVDLAAIEREFGRRLRMARSDEIKRLFPGLPPNALPPIADELQLETFVDQTLVPLTDVCFETADPRRLVRIDGESFRSLLYNAWCGRITRLES